MDLGPHASVPSTSPCWISINSRIAGSLVFVDILVLYVKRADEGQERGRVRSGDGCKLERGLVTCAAG